MLHQLIILRLVVLGCLALVSSVFAVAQEQNLRFQNLGPDQGISNIKVTSILQDSKGFMWFGTESGLNRYDGYSFKIYKNISKDSTSLRSNFIRCLFEDNEGNFWVGTELGLHLFDREQETFTFLPHYKSQDKKAIGIVTAIYQDCNNNLWIGTGLEGIFRYNKRKNTFIFYSLGISKLGNHIGTVGNTAFLEDREGNFWVGTWLGLGLYDPIKDTFSMINNNLQESIGVGASNTNYITAIVEDAIGNFWVGTSTGLLQFDRKTRKFSPYTSIPKTVPIITILSVQHNLLWVLTSKGLLTINTVTQEVNHYMYDPFDLTSLKLTSFFTSNIYMDKSGGFWIPTTGVDYFNIYKNKFNYKKYITENIDSLDACFSVSNANGEGPIIWAGVSDKLLKFDITSTKSEPYEQPYSNTNSSKNIAILNIFIDQKDIIWMSVLNDKGNQVLHKIIPSKKNVIRYNQFNNSNQLITEDDFGNLFVMTFPGFIYRYDRQKDSFLIFLDNEFYKKKPPNIMIFHVDACNNIWVGSHSGLYFYNPIEKKFKLIQTIDDDDPEYCKTTYWVIFEDSNNNIWVGTHKGLRLVDKEKLVFKKVWREKDGLPHDQIDDILEDDSGNLWISIDNGITKFNPIAETFRNYDQLDGVKNKEFYINSAKKISNGEMFFQGYSGIDIFHPDSIRDNLHIPSIVITDFQLFNKTVPVRNSFSDTVSYLSPLKKSIIYTDKIILQHWQNNFSFEFAALNYLNPQKNAYKYQLLGYDENWNETDAKRRYATYTNLSPKTYLFKVIGSNNDGIWNEEGASIRIIIRPPWYWAWWSKSLYAILFIGGVYNGYRFQLKRRLQQAETRRLKELDAVKTKLYTNITHEFRTPLTIISGMADEIKADANSYLEEGITMIKRNSQALLNLVNQMLELSKLESGTLRVNKIQADIITYLRYLTESFHSLAATKHIHLAFVAEEEELIMDYDPEKIQHIVVNLIANALKFTPEGGDIKLKVRTTNDEERFTGFQNELTVPRTSYLEFCVRDNGIGIAAEKLPLIFDRFYQVDDEATRKAEGTGIGLALTKELVKLLGGTITVESKLGEGSNFKISLPITQYAPIEKVETFFSPLGNETITTFIKSTTSLEEATEIAEAAALPLVLIVEDNPDVVRYLQTCLHEKYRTTIARNGTEGIEKAFEQIPDLIVSDVMMPEKDGFELCQTLKSDEKTSHIPIILLTAKGDIESKLEGFKHGADAYLVKPFHKEELLIRLEKLLELRQKLQAYYCSLAGVKITESIEEGYQEGEKEEVTFILKVKTMLENHLEESDFTVEDLCIEIGMSYSQLYRKLNALTGVSANPLLRSLRLSKAKLLLKNTHLTVSEVAYDTGFNDPHYFTRMFKKEFGISPTTYRDAMHK